MNLYFVYHPGIYRGTEYRTDYRDGSPYGVSVNYYVYRTVIARSPGHAKSIAIQNAYEHDVKIPFTAEWHVVKLGVVPDNVECGFWDATWIDDNGDVIDAGGWEYLPALAHTPDGEPIIARLPLQYGRIELPDWYIEKTVTENGDLAW